MASPIGHVAFGAAAAVVVARATGAPDSSALWTGAVLASVIPDFDAALPLLGFSERLHRNATHSLLFAATVIAVGLWLVHRLAPQPPFVLGAWTAALLSHYALDVITTGPTLGRLGWGIPLLWPLSRRRFYVNRPLFVGDRDKSHGLGDLLREAWEDSLRIVPFCALVLVAGELWR
jgi:membrane-bound metal-dependent hydrolase YbcI (DUF457 family)